MGPVENYFGEHLGLDWPYVAANLFPHKRKSKGVFKSSGEAFSVTVQILCQIAMIHLASPFISRNGSLEVKNV